VTDYLTRHSVHMTLSDVADLDDRLGGDVSLTAKPFVENSAVERPWSCLFLDTLR
jgi:hypothetical protein